MLTLHRMFVDPDQQDRTGLVCTYYYFAPEVHNLEFVHMPEALPQGGWLVSAKLEWP